VAASTDVKPTVSVSIDATMRRFTALITLGSFAIND
jgi:hypothetical protein